MKDSKNREPAPQSILCPTMIGRDAQREVLGQILTLIQNGQGQLALISGEAGIGKSRLVSEVKSLALNQGFAVLTGHCFETDRVLPYAPLLDLLRAFCLRRSSAELGKRLAPYATEFVKLLPELTGLWPDLSLASGLEAEQEKAQRFQTLIRFFIDFASPLLLIIEDIHWCDDSSLEFLLRLAYQMDNHPILLVLTYRNDEVQPTLSQFLATLDRARLAYEIELPPLEAADVEAMIGAIFQQSQPIRREFVETIQTLTDGNPFFVEETLKALVISGDIYYEQNRWTRKPLTELHIPRSVQEAVERRSQQLSDNARQLLTLAAIAGRRFNFGLLQQLTGYAEDKLLTLIKELIVAQFVSEESDEQFIFRHALTQHAIKAQLLMRERKVLHRRIAEALEALYGAMEGNGSGQFLQDMSKRPHPSNILAANLASHFEAAEIWSKTLHYALLAGEQALVLYAPRAALEQFTRALKAKHRLKQPIDPALHRMCGQAYAWLSEFELAQTAYKEALTVARNTRNRSAEWQVLIDLGELAQEHDFGRAGIYFQAALELARQFADQHRLAYTLTWLGRWHSMIDQPQAAWQYQQEACAIFQALNDQQGLAITLSLLGWTSYIGANLSVSIKYYTQAAALCRTLDERRWLTFCLAGLAMQGCDYLNILTPWPYFDIGTGLQLGEEAMQIARQIGYRSGEVRALLWLAFGLGPRGNYTQALDYAHRACQISEEDNQNRYMATAHLCLGILYLELWQMNNARQHLETAHHLARQLAAPTVLDVVLAYLSMFYIEQQEFDNAQSVLHIALTDTMPMQSQPQRILWWAQTELLLARKEATVALQLVDRLIATPAAIEDEVSSEAVIIPYLWYLHGRVFVALEQFEKAEAVFQLGLQMAQTHMMRPLLWRIHADLARLYKRQRRQQQVQSHYFEAQVQIQALAASLEDKKLRTQFIQQATAQLPSLTTPTQLQAAKQAYDGLTARERQVATLIAQGKSNRAIADTFVVQERTVEKHVENILSKLGFTSRTQIAVWTVEKGLT